MSIPHVLAMFDEPWAMQPEKLAALYAVVRRHHAGVRLTDEEIRAAIGDRPGSAVGPTTQGFVAVLPLYGSLFPRANLITEQSGGTSLQRFAAQLRGLTQDPGIKAILIDADSPGGSVLGVPEAHAAVAEAAAAKLVVAQINTVAASAAYWIVSAADEIAITPSGLAGSIGAFIAHEDRSKALENEGVKVEYVSAGEGKTDANPHQPLTDEARANLQKRVNEIYGGMVRDISRGRAVSGDAVRSTWKANTYGAAEAVSLGMADRVSTIEATLKRLASGAGRAAAKGPQAEVVSARLDALAAGRVWNAEAEAWEDAPPAPPVAYDGEAERRLRAASFWRA